VVEVEEALGAGGQGFLEQHDALVGLTAEEQLLPAFMLVFAAR
jgi:hypothetical protein